jgi:hypothetical protein
MKLVTQKYLEQLERWPEAGKHILAQYDEHSIIVYQAYRPAIGRFAAKHQYFGGEFSYSRMSWIKPNFLWMMYRSGWGTKPGQEITLAIRLHRPFFDELLRAAFPSTNILGIPDAEWKQGISATNVRLQWDPDHDPPGTPLERRAIQLGLRGEFLQAFKGDGIVSVEDISDFVAQQYDLVKTGQIENLVTPAEHVYPVAGDAARNLGMK